jgi:endonuclease YncB( thermonuclease family)
MNAFLKFVVLGLSSLPVVLASVALASVPVIPAGQSFICTPTHVWDGDGPIWCAEGPHVRLAGVAAREMDGSCNRNQPCPRATAVAARDALVLLVGAPSGIGRHGHILVDGPTMQCKSDGSAGRNRTAAWCVSPKSGDVNCNIISGGWALRWDRYWRGHRC